MTSDIISYCIINIITIHFITLNRCNTSILLDEYSYNAHAIYIKNVYNKYFKLPTKFTTYYHLKNFGRTPNT